MMLDERSALAAFMNRLLSEGRVVFLREEAQQALGVGRSAFLDAAGRQQRRGNLLSPRRGFYVIVPPQYHRWGAPPPAWFIDDLMRHEDQPYYVGLLKAAELHGASHQAVMEFQIITNKRMARIKAGRSVIGFYYRKDFECLRRGIEQQQTDAGSIAVSSVELTLLDLVRYPRAAGGLDHIATVLGDLGPRVNMRKLSDIASAFERSVIQRLGYLIERFGEQEFANMLLKKLSRNGVLPWVELEPSLGADPDFAPEPIEKNERWRVVVRRMPEPDI